MSLGESTVRELIAELARRVPAFVIACCVPDDRDSVNTITHLVGHRATTLGLAHLLVAHAETQLGMRPEFGVPDDGEVQ